MKHLLIIFLLLIIGYSSMAQENEDDEIMTLFGNGGDNGGYGGFSFGYSTIGKRSVAQFGGRGAWIIDHYFAIGAGGTGFVSDFDYDNVFQADANYVGGYGGILFEPIILPRFPVHLSIPVLLGGGGIGYARKMDNTTGTSNYDNYVEDSEPFMFVKPGAELELNLTTHIRLALGMYYMYTSEINLIRTSNTVLNTYSVSINLKFGKF